MAVRFQGTFSSTTSPTEIQVTIHDNNEGGSREIKIESCKVYLESEARNPLSRINPQRAEVSFWIEDAEMFSFISDLATFVTDRFYLVIGPSYLPQFVGVVTHDFIEYEDLPYPFLFTINAVDGILRMKDIDYLDSNGDPYIDDANSNYISCLDHLFNCFEKLNLDSFYPTSFFNNKHVYMLCNWYATNMKNTSDNPLSMAYVNSDLFYETDNEGKKTAKKCFYVLITILEAFGMRINASDGFYLLEQLSERNPGSNTFHTYSIDGTDRGKVTQSWKHPIDKEFRYPKSIGTFSFISALRQVKIRYEYDLEETSLEPQDDTAAYGHTAIGDEACFRGIDTSTGIPRDPNAATAIRPFIRATTDIDPVKFRFHCQMFAQSTMTTGTPYTDWVDHRYIIQIKIVVSEGPASLGATYLYYKRTLGYDYVNPIPDEPEWASATFSDSDSSMNERGYEFVTIPFVFRNSDISQGYFDIGFETIAYPETLDKDFRVYFCIKLYDVIDANGNSITTHAPGVEYDVQTSFSDVSLIIAKDNLNAKARKEIKEYVSSIQDGGKGEITINAKIGDYGMKSVILVDDGSGLTYPGGWGVGGGGAKDLGQLNADETHKIMGAPIRLMNKTVIGSENITIASRKVLDYDGESFLAMNTEHDYHLEEISGTWWALAPSKSSPAGVTTRIDTIQKEYHRLDDEKQLVQPGNKRNDRGINGSGFTAGATEFIFTDGKIPAKTDVLEKDMRKRLRVYRGGVKLTYVEGTPVGPREHSINNINNSITFDANWALEAHEEIEVFLE